MVKWYISWQRKNLQVLCVQETRVFVAGVERPAPRRDFRSECCPSTQFYTGCVDNELTSLVLVDAGSGSSTDFERRKHRKSLIRHLVLTGDNARCAVANIEALLDRGRGV